LLRQAEGVTQGKRGLGLVLFRAVRFRCFPGLGFAPPQVLAERRRKALFAFLVFASHLRHMARASGSGKPG